MEDRLERLAQRTAHAITLVVYRFPSPDTGAAAYVCNDVSFRITGTGITFRPPNWPRLRNASFAALATVSPAGAGARTRPDHVAMPPGRP